MTDAQATSVRLHGRDGKRSITISPPVLLAPMEGVTDPLFRTLVSQTGGVGAAITEFIRISSCPLPRKVIARALGPRLEPCPVAAQLMAPGEEHLAATVAAAEEAGADWIDLNFGCPAPVVFKKCAGSALLAHPDLLKRIVATAVQATTLPVSVKMRAGVQDSGRMRECLLAVADAGCAMITMHARLRVHSYAMPAQWPWINEARDILTAAGHRIPLVGNGSIDTPEDCERMRRETGCNAVMIGRAALADPWIFRRAAGGAPATAQEAAAFALAYSASITAARSAEAAKNKLKQLLRYYSCGGLFDGREEDRRRLLRSSDLHEIEGFFASYAGGVAEPAPGMVPAGG